MKIKLSFWALALAFPLAIISCKKDDDNDDKNNDDTSLEFKDQNLKGVLSGDAWEFVSGSAEEGFDSTDIGFELHNSLDTNLCDFYSPDGLTMTAYVPKTVGVHDVSFFSENSASFFDEDEQSYILASKGKVEVLSIDETNDVVKGRMVVEFEGGDQVNGNFTLSLCEW